MKQIANTIILLVLMALLPGMVSAQSSDLSLKGDGSAVVISVLAIIFIGMFVYIFFTDRKLSRLEKEIKERKS
jgi:CcmD family protein